LSFIKKILTSQLFKISSLNSVSVLLRLFTGLITSKVIAIFVGPSGMVFIGNFRNFISTVEGVSTLAFTSGIVKYVGENDDNQKELARIISTVFITFLVIALILSSVIFLFSEFLCLYIFGNNFQFEIIFKVVAVVLPFNVVSVLFLSIINGLGRYDKVIFANIVGNIFGVLLSIVLIYNFQTIGAILSIALIPALLFIVNFVFLPKELHFFKKISLRNYSIEIVKKLAVFSLMILPAMLLSPFFSLQTRNFLIENVGFHDSGFWEAISRISSIYLMFVGTLVSVYFYPKLIKAKDRKETKGVFWNYYKSIIPVFIIGAIVVYFSRFLIIEILFTSEFLPVSELFFWQLIADILKVTGIILAYQLLAKKIVLPYIIIELFSIFLLYSLSLYFIDLVGIQGVVIAQAINNFIYLLILVIYFRKSLF